MKWSCEMGKMLRMIFGIPPSSESAEKKKYEIKPKMITPDVVRMDMKSFRSSQVVRQQASAAKSSFDKKQA